MHTLLAIGLAILGSGSRDCSCCAVKVGEAAARVIVSEWVVGGWVRDGSAMIGKG